MTIFALVSDHSYRRSHIIKTTLAVLQTGMQIADWSLCGILYFYDTTIVKSDEKLFIMDIPFIFLVMGRKMAISARSILPQTTDSTLSASTFAAILN